MRLNIVFYFLKVSVPVISRATQDKAAFVRLLIQSALQTSFLGCCTLCLPCDSLKYACHSLTRSQTVPASPIYLEVNVR